MSIPPPGPLAYEGQVAIPYIIVPGKTPTMADNNFTVPTIWVDPTNSNAFMIVSKPLGVATWINLGNLGPFGPITQLTGDAGTPIVPDGSGNANVEGDTTTITISGDGVNTLTASIVPPVTVPYGGTGDVSLTSYAPVCGGITTTGALQSASTGISNSGYFLTSNGASSLPSWSAGGMITTPVTVPNGGTGDITLSQYGVLVGEGASAVAVTAPGALGTVLIGNGASADPTFSSTIQQHTNIPLTVTSDQAAVVAELEVSNTSGSNAALVSSVAKSSGSTADTGFFSSGQYDTTKYWNFGMATSTSTYPKAYNISYSSTQGAPESGAIGLSITAGASNAIPSIQINDPFANFNLEQIFQKYSANANTYYQIQNANAGALAHSFVAVISEAGGGDCFTTWDTYDSGISHDVTTWVGGIDNASSDSFKIGFALTPAATVTPSNSTNCLTIDTSGNVTIPTGNFTEIRSAVGGKVELNVQNADGTNNTSSARIDVQSAVGGGDAYIYMNAGANPRSIGVQQSTGNFLFNNTFSAASNNIDGTNIVTITPAGNITLQATSANILSINNDHQATAGALAGYMKININGSPYVIPYYSPS